MSSAVKFQHVGKTFRSPKTGQAIRVLEQINLHVDSGELVALVGPSGCGKSTLLNIVAGLEDCTEGTITFDHPRKDICLSVVFQQPRLVEWLTAAENIALVLEATVHDAKERLHIAMELLDKVQLSAHANTWPQFLSGGQRQRVAIARAFATHPDVLLLDEPFSALDEFTARHLRNLVQRLWSESGSKQKPTGLLVTHNLMEAAFLADRIVVLGGTPAHSLQMVEVDLKRPRELDSREIFEVHRRITMELERSIHS